MESTDVSCMPNIAYFVTNGTDEDFNVAVSSLKASQIDFSKKRQ
jgi:hypothetical protein